MIWKMCFIVVLITTIGNGSAWYGPFEINNETYYHGDRSVADEHGVPDKVIKSNEAHLLGYVDIVGFENMGVVDDVRYINESPHKAAIVKRDAWHTPVDGKVMSFRTIANVIDTDYVNKNDTTTALQYTLFLWKYKVCGIHGCYWVYVLEDLTITDTVDSPQVFNNSIGDHRITITAYNNSVTPYTLIYIPPRWNIIKETVEYKNNITTMYRRVGWVTTNEKGTEHVHFTNKSLPVYDPTQTIVKRAEYYVINEAPLNWSLLNISVFTPYIEISDVPCNVTVVHSKPSDYVHWKLMLVFVSVIAFFVIIAYMVLNWRRT